MTYVPGHRLPHGRMSHIVYPQERIGPVAYRFKLPRELDRIHGVFYVSMLRKYRTDPFHLVAIVEIEVQLDLLFEEELVEIVACEVKVLRN